MRSTLVVLFAYLIGSIPFGYLIVRLRHGADVRNTGSGGTGATNVSRRAGKAAGVITLLLDAAKGVAAVMIAKSLVQSTWVVGAAAVAALLGHIFPIWLKFRGGKGVATGLGVMAVLAPLPTMIAAVAFAITFLITHYVSLSSMMAAAVLPVVVFLRTGPEGRAPFLAALAGSLLIIWAHRENISRLRAGSETKFR